MEILPFGEVPGRPINPRQSESFGPLPVGKMRELAGSELLEYCTRAAGLDTLPNDLTRMLYLASLRDCNSGHYLHPQLTHVVGLDAADQGLYQCHRQTFRSLLRTPLSGYVLQLQDYVRYARAEVAMVLDTWQSLGAYRATVPLRALPIYSELFALNIELAMAILQAPKS